MLLPTVYEDAGISGGTLERPGLQRLLDDIDAGLVEQIVVYKVDRLTRSLSDFAKLVERLEVAGAVFVSVTQSFNTATSMGRLTLHMLLSFAQFKREVTAERIRDKVAASKRKGLWMGGRVPLGYEKDERNEMRRLLVGTGRLAVVAKHFLELHLVKLFLPNHGARELLQVDARILYRFEEVDIELHSVLLVVHAFLENRLERMLKGLFEGRHTERWVATEASQNLTYLLSMVQGLGSLCLHEFHDWQPIGAGHHERIVGVANDPRELLLQDRI